MQPPFTFEIKERQNDSLQKRIDSIDVLRGIVMIIMALDHTRDFFHFTANSDDPLNLLTTSPLLYFTRWITHFCAPTFVFLSGASIYLQGLRKTKKELSTFVIKRGLWLIFAEVAINTLFWSFNPFYNFIALQVLWAIGISMVILGVLVRLPFKLILALGLTIVLGHNLLDIPESAKDFKPGLIWDLVHHGGFYPFTTNHFVGIMYPFLPWTGLMMMGYCAGKLFSPQFTAAQRRKILALTGAGLLIFFTIVRFINVYGDPIRWTEQKTGFYTFLSFINVYKYPPSLMYMSVTIGFGLLFLSFIENIQNPFTRFVRVFGRTAFFYYILHVLLIHLILTGFFFYNGHTMHQAVESMQTGGLLFIMPGVGYSLKVVYLIWAIVVLALYPLCKWYDRYKTNHREKWWLSYL